MSIRADPDICICCGGLTDRPYLDCARCRQRRKFLNADERRASRAMLGAEFAEPLVKIPDRVWRESTNPPRSSADDAESALRRRDQAA